ncbi:hypothetical protein LUZ60_005686 [Juncus effusus]|nr:hypothetical protein LUZ60_005686 [Juncus effusus]
MAKKRSSSYEEERQRNVEENKKKIEALKLHHLSIAIQKPQIPKTPPQIKQRRPRIDIATTPTRRSRRLANLPESKSLKEDYYNDSSEIMTAPRRIIRVNSDRLYLMNQAPVSEELRERALKKAEDLQSKLDPSFPSFIRSMLHSHVTRGFWFGLYKQWCVDHLPKSDCTVTLIDEDGAEFDTKFFSVRTALSGGWQGFAVAHKLVDGDACVFHLVNPTTFKVYIIRAHECE